MTTALYFGAVATPNCLGNMFPCSLTSGFTDDTILWRETYNYQRRSIKATQRRIRYLNAWPSSGFMSGDMSVPMGQFGQCIESGGSGRKYEPWSLGIAGTQTTKFINGICVDSLDVPVSYAIVQGFRTADDEFIGEVSAGEDGTYTLPTNNPASTQHYLVAYKPGSPDIAGTTVNTLLPTNIDGT